MTNIEKLLATPDKYNRSAQGNGSNWLRGLDKRSAGFRRLRDLMRGFLADLGNVSERQIQIARRAATLAMLCEELDRKAAEGQQIDMNLYSTASNTLRRLLIDLGLEQREGSTYCDRRSDEEVKASLDHYIKHGSFYEE